MHSVVLWPVVGLSLLLAVVGLGLSLVNRAADRLLLALAGIAELAVLVQSIIAGVGVATGHALRSTPTFLAYLVGIVLVLPVALVWAWADRNRWSGGVIAIGGVTVAVMTARLLMMWQGRV